MSTVTLTRPSAPPEEPLYEIVDGQRVELPPMSTQSSLLAFQLAKRLDAVVESKQLGTVAIETMFVLDLEKDLRRRPDVAFVSAERWPLDRQWPVDGDWNVIPELAVEVLSPNDTMREVLAKLRQYFRYGVREVWVVVPTETNFMVYYSFNDVRVIESGGVVETVLIPGLRVSVATFFGLPQPQP